MYKEILKVLVVDKPLEFTKLVALLETYKIKGYDIFILPSTKENEETEVVLFNNSMLSILEQLFIIETLHNKGDPFYCFDLEKNSTQELYDVLSKEFEVNAHNLTNVEA
jgi:hypothetical protein